MATMDVTRFKTHCLGILDRIQDVPEALVLTKRGKVIAKVVPTCDATDTPWEHLRGTAHSGLDALLLEEDIWEEG
jgi:antitoxin (DNA-binding transcriptional repressor) of toxin-antitoxin stability system